MKLALAIYRANRADFHACTAATIGLTLVFVGASWLYPLGVIGHIWSMIP